jgi:hypothetical protein
MTQQEWGVDDARHCHWYQDDDDNGRDLPPPLATGAKATNVAMHPSPPTDEKIDYSNKDSRQCHKRREVDNSDKQ